MHFYVRIIIGIIVFINSETCVYGMQNNQSKAASVRTQKKNTNSLSLNNKKTCVSNPSLIIRLTCRCAVITGAYVMYALANKETLLKLKQNGDYSYINKGRLPFLIRCNL